MPPKKIPGPKNWEVLLTNIADLTGEDVIIRKKIIAYAVTFPNVTIPALNSKIGLPNIQHARWEAITPLSRPITLRWEAEKAFFDQNVIFVSSFNVLREHVTRRFLPAIKKVYVKLEANMTVNFSQREVTKLHGIISTALSDCEKLEELVVAVTYKSVAARKTFMGIKHWPELRVLVSAMRSLEVERKFVLVCGGGDRLEEKRGELLVGEVQAGKTVEDCLARAKPGTAFEV